MADLIQQQTPENIWKRLTRLFRSGPVVRHKIAAGERYSEPQGTARAYKKEISSLYVHSLASYGQYERLSRYADYSEMEFCISGDTLIAVPDGFKTIRELAEMYGQNEPFIIYSFDHDRGEIVPAWGRQARKTRTDMAYRVKFDNGKEITGTADHRLMLRDGSYRVIGDLRSGDAMMPFYRRDQSIYTCKRWVSEHRLLAEIINGKKRIEKFCLARFDITFANILQVAEQNGFNLDETSRRLDVDAPTIKRRLKEQSFQSWEAFTRVYDPEWQNRGQNRDLTFQMICDAFEPGIDTYRLAKKLGTISTKIKSQVKQHGYQTTGEFCETYANCKVASVEPVGIIDLYDLTVDGYKNFATDSVVSHNTPEIASALDIYSDEATAKNERGEILQIISNDDEIKNVLETLFYDILNIEFNIWSWARNLCKYGDFILFVDASEQNGILNLLPIPINEIEREEGYDKKDPFAVRFRWLTQGNMILENWQIIHFRMLGNDNFLPYGSSMLEAARRIWRQLILIEDAMMVYRIVRSPERRVFKIDVGNIPPDQVEAQVEKVKSSLKRQQITDPTTGRVDLRYNPLSVDEDYFIPVRGDRSSDISTLAGGQFTGDIDDVQYIQNKLFAALKIPKAYLAYAEGEGSKATLAQMDVRFARTIERIQKFIVAELSKVAIAHLILLGYDVTDVTKFELKLSNASHIAEQQFLEIWARRLEIAASAMEGVFDREFIWKNIFKLSDDEIDRIREGKKIDKLEDLYIEQVRLPEEFGGADQMPPGSGGMPSPGGPPGGSPGGMPPPGGSLGGMPPGEMPPPGGPAGGSPDALEQPPNGSPDEFGGPPGPPMTEAGMDTQSPIGEASAALPQALKPLKLDGFSNNTSPDLLSQASLAPEAGHGRVEGGQTDATGKRRVKQPSDQDYALWLRSFIKNPAAATENHFERSATLMTESVEHGLKQAEVELLKMKKLL